jgi:hypothetical protein
VGDAAQCRMLVIMGSGETSPTMVTIHKALMARLGPGEHNAVLLDTAYAFQENVSDISARAQAYFARSVGLKVSVISDADLPPEKNPEAPAALAAIRSADWVFAGPGSPTYALARWRGGPVADALRERIAGGAGLTVIASAAAAATGFVAVPVYEIYKVGADPHWLAGLDLFGLLGLKVAVIPHYDNAEGGTHDTRFCYLGERRLAILERELPDDAAVLGVDEHTALILDLTAMEVEVVGRGVTTVRKAGVSTVLPPGTKTTLDELRSLVRSGKSAAGNVVARHDEETSAGEEHAGQGYAAMSLNEVTADSELRFAAATSDRDSRAMVSAILDLEAAIEAWATDTDENDDSERARAVLRGLVSRLGRAAEQGLIDPSDRLRPAVEPLIALREALRTHRSYAAADVIRDALAAAGIELRDTPDGTRWELTQGA